MSEEVTLDEFVGSDNPHTSEWKVRSLGDLAEYKNGNAFSKSEWGDEGYPIIRIQNLTGEQDDFNYYDGDLEERYEVEAGDTLLSWSATIDVFQWSGPKAALNQHIFRIDTSDEVNDTFYRFKLGHLLPRFVALSHGSTMQHVRKADLVNVDANIPPLPEQRKIATVLYTVDRAIEKTKKIISQVESVLSRVTDELLIKGYGEKELEQNGIYSFEFQMPIDWEVVELQMLNKDAKPICYGIVQPGEYHEDGVPILNIEHSRHGHGIDVDELHRVNTQLHEKYSRSKLTGGEIVISVKGSTGDVGRVPLNIDEWNISRDLARISHSDGVNRDWLRFYLSTNLAQKFIHVNSPGSTRDSLNISDLKKLPVLLPPQEEQRRIADVVAQIEHKLDYENRYIHQLRRLKRGLRQDLLSGTVRTTDTTIEVPEEIAQYG